eukprot:TRINITY_DN3437_c0_g1_i1.p1 TRINITY_DN3437_c0_g1~~TRINITY_DN3437_c0_g1_i1.p1  ORF type:complete len:778 (+),score=242.76 TRINITY_DN3437_c0_g1_i1:259-2592(+)
MASPFSSSPLRNTPSPSSSPKRYSPDYKDVRKDEKLRKEAQNKLKKKSPRDSNEDVVSPTKLRSAADVCHRLRWDLALSSHKDHFGIGYEENSKIVDTPFRDFKWDEVSANAIKYIRYYDRVVWDKKHRLDHFFGSSAPSHMLQNATIEMVIKEEQARMAKRKEKEDRMKARVAQFQAEDRLQRQGDLLKVDHLLSSSAPTMSSPSYHQSNTKQTNNNNNSNSNVPHRRRSISGSSRPNRSPQKLEFIKNLQPAIDLHLDPEYAMLNEELAKEQKARSKRKKQPQARPKKAYSTPQKLNFFYNYSKSEARKDEEETGDAEEIENDAIEEKEADAEVGIFATEEELLEESSTTNNTEYEESEELITEEASEETLFEEESSVDSVTSTTTTQTTTSVFISKSYDETEIETTETTVSEQISVSDSRRPGRLSKEEVKRRQEQVREEIARIRAMEPIDEIEEETSEDLSASDAKKAKRLARKMEAKQQKMKKKEGKLKVGNTVSRPNFFVSIRTHHPSIVSFIKAVQKKITDRYPMFSEAMVNADSLHITLNVMKLGGESDIAKAISAMEAFQEHDLGSILPDTNWKYLPPGWWPEEDEASVTSEKTEQAARGLSTADSEVFGRFYLPLWGLGRIGSDVLFASIAEGPELVKLHEMFEALKKRFVDVGLGHALSDVSRPYNPHLTVFKMSKVHPKKKKMIKAQSSGAFSEAFSFAKECAKAKRLVSSLSQSAGDVIEADLGSISPFQPVTCIELSSMTQKEDNYYKCYHRINLNETLESSE